MFQLCASSEPLYRLLDVYFMFKHRGQGEKFSIVRTCVCVCVCAYVCVYAGISLDKLVVGKDGQHFFLI